MSIPGPAGGGPHQQPREATTWRSRDDECGLGGVPGARGSGCPRRAKRLPRQPWAELLADVLCRLRPAAGLGLDSLDCALCTDWPTVLMLASSEGPRCGCWCPHRCARRCLAWAGLRSATPGASPSCSRAKLRTASRTASGSANAGRAIVVTTGWCGRRLAAGEHRVCGGGAQSGQSPLVDSSAIEDRLTGSAVLAAAEGKGRARAARECGLRERSPRCLLGPATRSPLPLRSPKLVPRHEPSLAAPARGWAARQPAAGFGQCSETARPAGR